MSNIDEAKVIWEQIKSETHKRANTAERVGLAGLKTLDAIFTKVEMENGKGLSTNDYTAADKTEVAKIINKVDKVAGKGLSTNDYTSVDKAEVAKVANKQNALIMHPSILNYNPDQRRSVILATASIGLNPFGGSYLVGSDFYNLYLEGASFNNCDLSTSSLQYARFSNCSFNYARFNGSNLSNSRFYSCSFMGVTPSDFINVNISGCDFTLSLVPTQYVNNIADLFIYANILNGDVITWIDGNQYGSTITPYDGIHPTYFVWNRLTTPGGDSTTAPTTTVPTTTVPTTTVPTTTVPTTTVPTTTVPTTTVPTTTVPTTTVA